MAPTNKQYTDKFNGLATFIIIIIIIAQHDPGN